MSCVILSSLLLFRLDFVADDQIGQCCSETEPRERITDLIILGMMEAEHFLVILIPLCIFMIISFMFKPG